MVWMSVERETNGGPVEGLLGCGLLIVMPIVWWQAGWEYGLAAWFGSVIVWATVSSLLRAWRLPPDTRPASEHALAAFRRLYSADQVLGIAVRAVEPTRFVFSIRYQKPDLITEPPPRRYFAVTRTDSPVVVELDAGDWPVYGLK